MSTEQTKALAIAKLKNGEDHEEIGIALDISPTIIEEWSEELKPGEMVAKEVNAIALDKATGLLVMDKKQDTVLLEDTLIRLALAITDEVKVGLHDHEIAKAINISADTVSKLYNSFFSKGAQIAIVNNSDNHSSKELNTFRGALRS